MKREGSVRIGVLLLAALTTACGNNSPVGPAPASAGLTVTAISLTGHAQVSGGYAYQAVVHLREVNGVQATVVAVDLTFLTGTTSLATLHADHPISDTNNICPAHGTVDTRDLTTIDANVSHPYATTVQVTVTFTDALSHTGTTTATVNVPPITPPPPPTTATLAGVVSDDSTGQGIPGGNVQVLDGPNAGRASTTDGNGYYSIPGLSLGSFTVHATAAGYNALDQGVTVANDTRLDSKLHRTNTSPPPPAPCAYAISPTTQSVGEGGATFTATVTQTSGSCGWQAVSDSSWISFSSAPSGSGSGTLTYVVQSWAGNAPRTGNIVIEWSGGSVQLTVTQAAPLPPLCAFRFIPPSLPVPLAPSPGQMFSFTVQGQYGPGCGWQATASDSWIHIEAGGLGVDSGQIMFTVDPLSSGTRTGTITLSSVGGTPVYASATVTQE